MASLEYSRFDAVSFPNVYMLSFVLYYKRFCRRNKFGLRFFFSEIWHTIRKKRRMFENAFQYWISPERKRSTERFWCHIMLCHRRISVARIEILDCSVSNQILYPMRAKHKWQNQAVVRQSHRKYIKKIRTICLLVVHTT